MNSGEFLMAELARISYLDGRTEGINGCLAVAFTLRNRVRLGWEGGNWSRVLSSVPKYRATDKPQSTEVPDPGDYLFRTVLQEINGVFTGVTEDRITVAGDLISTSISNSVGLTPSPVLFYGRLDDISREWFLKEISQNTGSHRLIAQVGTMAFFN